MVWKLWIWATANSRDWRAQGDAVIWRLKRKLLTTQRGHPTARVVSGKVAPLGLPGCRAGS